MALRNYFLLGFLMLCGFAIAGQLYVTLPLVSYIVSRFSVTAESAAFASSAFGFAYAAGFLIFGPLSDRYGRKRVILAGLAVTALVTLFVGIVQNFGLLLAARAVQGLVASIFPPAALSLVAEELPPSHRPLGISLMSFAFLGAAPIAQYFAGMVGALPPIMFIVMPVYLVGAVGLLFIAKADQAKTVAATSADATAKSGFGALLSNRVILFNWLAAFTVLFGFVSFYGGAQALNAKLHLDLQTLRLVGLPPMLLALGAAPITRKFGSSVTARIGLAVMAAALVIATIGTANAVLTACIVLSSGVALAVPGLIAMIAEQATHKNRAFALAIYTFTLFLGASAAPPTAQALVIYGAGPALLLPAILLAMAVFAITVSVRR